MLVQKKSSLQKDKETYEMGLGRLIDAEEKVKILDAELQIKNIEVTKQKNEASIIAERIGKEEAIVKVENDAAKIKELACDEISARVAE